MQQFTYTAWYNVTYMYTLDLINKWIFETLHYKTVQHCFYNISILHYKV